MSVPRWNMRAVISTVDIERSRTGMYVKYEDHAEAIAALKSQRDELLAVLKICIEAMDERRGYAEMWEYKYGEKWDEEDAKARAAISRAEAKETTP